MNLYQKTLFKAFKAHPRLPADANHRAWLYRITSNTFISGRRKRSRDTVMTAFVEQIAANGAPTTPPGSMRATCSEISGNSSRDCPPTQRVTLIMRKY